MAIVIEVARSYACQLGPGLGLTVPPPTTLVPFIPQIAACPSVF